MRIEHYFCDRCKQEIIIYDEIFYIHHGKDKYGDKNNIEICQQCLIEFKEFIKEKK